MTLATEVPETPTGPTKLDKSHAMVCHRG